MPDIHAGSRAKIMLAPEQKLRVVAAGTVVVEARQGASITPVTLTNGTQEFGPYFIATQLYVSVKAGRATYDLSRTAEAGPVSLTGTSGLGRTVSAMLAGGWTATSWEWHRVVAGVDSTIAGATSSTYTQQAADVVPGVAIYAKPVGLVPTLPVLGAPPAAPAPAPVFAGVSRMVAFGDSITEQPIGQSGITNASQKWTVTTAAALGLPLLNQALSGTVMQNRADAGGSPRANNGRSRYVAALLGANLSTDYFLTYGTNDMRYNGAPDTMNLGNFIADYSEVVAALIAAGVDPLKIRISSIPYMTDYGYTQGSTGFTGSDRTKHEAWNAGLLTMAQGFGTLWVDFYGAVRDGGAGTVLNTDGLHPLPTGSVVMNTAALAAVPAVNVAPAAPAPSPAPTPPAPTPPAPAPAPGVATAATFSATNANWRTVAADRYDSSVGTTTFDAIARITGSVTVGTEAWVEMQFNAADAGGVIVLDPSSALTPFANSADRAFLVQLINDGRVYTAINNAVSAPMPVPFTFGGLSATTRVRMRLAANGVVTCETTTDDWETMTVRQTLGSPIAADTVVYFKLYATGARDIYQPRQYGIA